MRQITATHRGDRSTRMLCCCDNASYAYFVAANVARIIPATDRSDKILSRSDNDFYMSHEAICCSNLSQGRVVAAICRIVCFGLK